MSIEAMKDALITLILARGSIEDWGGYASEYFQNKHDLKGDISKVDKAITSLRQAIEQYEKQVCVGCEGNPQGENIPCAVCGATPQPQQERKCDNCGEFGSCCQQPQREWVGLTDGLKVILIKNAPNWTVIQLIEETEQLLKDQNS